MQVFLEGFLEEYEVGCGLVRLSDSDSSDGSSDASEDSDVSMSSAPN